MAQFDFPRINFGGKVSINPATANNNVWLPLVLFNPISVQAVMPPRVYLTEELKTLYSNGTFILPEGNSVKTDNGLFYVEIHSVNTTEIFKQWATTPLGKSNFDQSYHSLYDQVRTVRNNIPLTGLIPANWNYYGGMEFKFDSVKVCSVDLPGTNGQPKNYNSNGTGCPSEIKALLGAHIDLRNDQERNTAVMIDVIPNLSLYTQVFCDALRMTNDQGVVFIGKPSKASLRFLNTNRIVNLEGAEAGSGTFFCVIPIEELQECNNYSILNFFKQYKRSSNISGLFIRYNLFEVKENQQPDYRRIGVQPNPATASIVGSITPWYENELKSITMGRQLIPQNSYLENKKLAPIVCLIDMQRQAICLDVIGSIPETVTKTDDHLNYETFDLGTLQLTCVSSENEEIELGRFTVNSSVLSRKQLTLMGGIIEIPFETEAVKKGFDIEAGLLHLYQVKKGGAKNKDLRLLLMKECEYMISSDQAGLYLDQFDDPKYGYRSYSSSKEPCKVQVYHKGSPIKQTIPMVIMEIRIQSSASAAQISPFLKTQDFDHDQPLHFPTDQAASCIYVLFPGSLYSGSNYLIPYMLDTGFFINLRVLPQHDYGRYLDPQHPLYPTPLTFDIIYKEVLEAFDLIYPASAIITPFTEDNFRQGWKYIRSRLSPENWSSHTYMPSSRDLSHDQWNLLCSWYDHVSGSREKEKEPLKK